MQTAAMDRQPDPGEIAERIAALLGAELSMAVDPARILGERLYMRDVLLVCDAHRGGELAALSAAFRAALEARIDAQAARRRPPR